MTGVQVLCFCSSLGITLVWFLDVVLYQKLWLGAVVEMAKLEEKNKWLPRVNLNTLIVRQNKKFSFFQSYFYIGINSVFIIIFCITSSYAFHIEGKFNLLLVFLALISIYLLSKLMMKVSGELKKMKTHGFEEDNSRTKS